MVKVLPISRRRQRRARVFLSGQIKGSDWKQEVRVRDLSERGALLECDVPPPFETELVLACGDFLVRGRVAWTGTFCVGVAFETAIDPEALERQIGPVLRVSAPRGFRGAALAAG